MMPKMRTTLDLDDPVLHAVKEIARREGRSAGAVASDLIRRGLAQSSANAQDPAPRHGFRPFAAGTWDPRVTNEEVNRLRDDQGV